jgi:hypothetical protein
MRPPLWRSYQATENEMRMIPTARPGEAVSTDHKLVCRPCGSAHLAGGRACDPGVFTKAGRRRKNLATPALTMRQRIHHEI